MAFNPLKEKGIPIDAQLEDWGKLIGRTYDKRGVDPYTRARVILMNGIETEAVLYSHQFHRNTLDMDLRRELALVRRAEQQQQKAVGWLSPADESDLEAALGHEQAAVDLTAFLARTEPDPYVKDCLDFALLEDFDHLYRWANLLKLEQDKDASEAARRYTEITVGRPTILQHRHPHDEVRDFARDDQAAAVTKLHILTITAAEQQAMAFYMNAGNRHGSPLGRGLYAEIAMAEEQHVTHYGSLLDPTASWFESLLLHEYDECWLYHSLMQHEQDGRVRKLWERHLGMELEHLHRAAALVKKSEKRDPEQLLPAQLPEDFKFEPNVDYVREILAAQWDYNAVGTEFIPGAEVPRDHRYHQVQSILNSDGVPSRDVVDETIKKFGMDCRLELKGEHPVQAYRQKVPVKA